MFMATEMQTCVSRLMMPAVWSCGPRHVQHMRWPCHMHAVMLRYREIVLQDCSEKWVVLSYHCASARPYSDVHMHACHGLYTVALGVFGAVGVE